MTTLVIILLLSIAALLYMQRDIDKQARKDDAKMYEIKREPTIDDLRKAFWK